MNRKRRQGNRLGMSVIEMVIAYALLGSVSAIVIATVHRLRTATTAVAIDKQMWAERFRLVSALRRDAHGANRVEAATPQELVLIQEVGANMDDPSSVRYEVMEESVLRKQGQHRDTFAIQGQGRFEFDVARKRLSLDADGFHAEALLPEVRP